MFYDTKFEYSFWNLNPAVLNKGEEIFLALAKKFNISIEETTDIENEAKDYLLESLVNAYQQGHNPFKESKPFLLSNLINKSKLDNLISYICQKYNLNEKDFNHDAYHDGTFLKVKYKNQLIE